MTSPKDNSKQPSEAEDAQSVWKSFLEGIQEKTPALAVTLERCRLVPSPTPEWKLVFKDAFSMERAKTRQAAVEAKLSEVAGKKIELLFEVALKEPWVDGDESEEPEPAIPEHMVPVAAVYEATKAKYDLQRRAVQWYATQKLIPMPERYGREAFYDKRTIFDYFELIQILSRKWDLSLTRIRKIIRHLESIEVVQLQNGDMSTAIGAMIAFLNDFGEYRDQIFSTYSQEDERTGETSLSGDAWNRLRKVESAIKERLQGDKDTLSDLLSKNALDIEEEIDQKGLTPDDLEEVPF